MDETITFEPPRRVGTIFHLGSIFILGGAVVGALIQATASDLGPLFLVFLIGALFLGLPLPILFYRLYALSRASYILERDGVRIRWGLRVEDIPMTEVRWVGPAEGWQVRLSLPWPRWPGAVLGAKRHDNIGAVEFIASRGKGLVLVVTETRAYALSPKDREPFLEAFQHQMEFGSLDPLPARSQYPRFLASELWGSSVARVLVLLGTVLSLALLILVGLAVPTRSTVSLGFTPRGGLADPVPTEQLFLLPVINLFFFLANFLLGAYFYRRKRVKPLAHILWGSSVLTVIIFLGALSIILANS